MYVGTEENSIPFYEGMNKIYLSCTSSYLHTLEKLGFDNEHLMFVLGQGEEHNEASWSHHINNFLKLGLSLLFNILTLVILYIDIATLSFIIKFFLIAKLLLLSLFYKEENLIKLEL